MSKNKNKQKELEKEIEKFEKAYSNQEIGISKIAEILSCSYEDVYEYFSKRKRLIYLD